MWGAPSIDQLPGCGLEVVLRESGDAGMGGVTDQKRFDFLRRARTPAES